MSCWKRWLVVASVCAVAGCGAEDNDEFAAVNDTGVGSDVSDTSPTDTSAVCGDGVVSSGEECDGANFAGTSCATLGFEAGTLTCGADCALDTTGCDSLVGPLCGDGSVDPDEDCDPESADPILSTCSDLSLGEGALTCAVDCSFDTADCQTQAVCGDGAVEGTEECDDGNTIDGDACSIDCIEQFCGDGLVQAGEDCDSGGAVVIACEDLEGTPAGIQYCDDDCGFTTVLCPDAETCGDGVVDIGESCDDGNNVDGDGCASTCDTETCGDGIVQDFEACDGADVSGLSCDSLGFNAGTVSCDACTINFDSCSFTSCGDGVLDASEECDDGANIDGDGCSRRCLHEVCGDGNIDTGEACDDGDANSDAEVDACRTDCSFASCGDGVVDADEACDDGNTIDSDTCTRLCTIPVCGDGVVQGDEQCDDGNDDDTDRCTTACEISGCGDGVVQGDEQCDDGNAATEVCDYGEAACTVCNATCQETDGATSVCGDAAIDDTNETCDDGNTETELCDYGSATCNVCGPACVDVASTGPFCGDGETQTDEGEMCDQGDGNGPACSLTCQDVNQCDPHPCDPLATCSDFIGSFACGDCPTGYAGTGDTECVETVTISRTSHATLAAQGVFRVSRGAATQGVTTVTLGIQPASTAQHSGSADDVDFSLAGSGVSAVGPTVNAVIANGQSFVDIMIDQANNPTADTIETVRLQIQPSAEYTVGASDSASLNLEASGTRVTDLTDSLTPTSGSLRQAMTNANQMAGARTVSIVPSGTILLAGRLPDANLMGSGTLTIQGPAGNVTLDAQGNSRSVETFQTTIIRNVNFTNGDGSAGPGGAILNRGHITLEDCEITNNTAQRGGGLSNEGNEGEVSADVTNCTFSGNTPDGIRGGPVTVTGCDFTGETTPITGGFTDGGGNSGLP